MFIAMKTRKFFIILTIFIICSLLIYDRFVSVHWTGDFSAKLLINNGRVDLQPNLILFQSYSNQALENHLMLLKKEKSFMDSWMKLTKKPKKGKNGIYELSLRCGGTSSGLGFTKESHVDKSIILCFQFSKNDPIFFKTKISENEILDINILQ